MKTNAWPLFLALCCFTRLVTAQSPVYQFADTLVAEDLYARAMAHFEADRYDSTVLLLDQAIEIYRATTGFEHAKAWDCWWMKGQAHVFQGQYDKAIRELTFNIELEKKVLGEGVRALGAPYYMLGSAYYVSGDLQNALLALEQSLQIRLQFLGNKHLKTASTYILIGGCQQMRGDYDRAIDAYQKAQDARMQLFAEGKGDSLTLFEGVMNMGMCFSKKGDYDRALDFYQQALKIQQEVDPGEKYLSGRFYREISSVYFSKNDLNNALKYNLKAADILRETLGENNVELALTYENMASIYMNLNINNDELFLSYTQKALQIWETLRAQGTQPLSIGFRPYPVLFANLGDYYLIHKNFDKGRESYQKALDLLQEVAPGSLEIYDCKMRLSRCLAEEGNISGAEKLCVEAQRMERHNPLEFLPIVVPATAELSLLHLKQALQQNDLAGFDQAWQDLLVFDESVQEKRAELTSEGSKMATTGYLRRIYERAIDAALQMSQRAGQERYQNEAFRLAEKVRALVLLEGARESEALQFGGLPDSLRARERSLRLDIAYLDSLLASKDGQVATDPDSISRALLGRLFDFKNEYVALKRRLERDYPTYYRFKYDWSEQDVPALQRQLAGDEAIVEYFTGDSSIFVFCIQKNAFTARKVKRDFPLDQWVAQLRTGLTAFNTDQGTMFAKYDSLAALYAGAAQQLYQKLVAPLPADLPERLVIVPDMVLSALPFEVLLTETPRTPATAFQELPYLLRRHEINYAYSSTYLSEARSRQTHRSSSANFYGFAPQYTGDTSLLQSLFGHVDEMRKNLAPLPYSGEEVFRAAKIMNGQAFVGAAASRSKFYEVAPNARILHLATHGQANDRVGNYCFLAFLEQAGTSGNEVLYANDIYNLHLNADLVVLSACETGLGELQGGEGVLSLARAFAYAGARGVVTSLWGVSDAHTKDLMLGFYRHLKKGERASAALRQAKLDVLKEKKGQHASPFYWAGFVGIGDLR